MGIIDETRRVSTDIKNGALPAEELPGFAWWLVQKSFWFWFVIIFIGGVLLLIE